MIEVFIHEEYVNKRREQKKQQQPQRRRRHMRPLQIEIDKLKLPPATAAAPGQQRPRDQNQHADVPRSPVGSPTADAATFRDHLFDCLKPY
ncbi:unnamed protein product [Miscanthus lutarioriparius]|uniref:Uncharacterized protein n=1 Tax=Miscanthus lutarioriparius TaxID=422564 RepID=A0A811PWB7_9POAL|nr:unnamed protein product [Miscanthus lutarioriparius]CAD6250868.1 unnamed protein product [Miscanthus lutarioriparius]